MAEEKTINVSVEYGGTSSITSGVVTSGTGIWYVGQTVSLVVDIPDFDTTPSGIWSVFIRDSADSSYAIKGWHGSMPADPFPITYSFKLESDSILDYTFRIVIEIM